MQIHAQFIRGHLGKAIAAAYAAKIVQHVLGGGIGEWREAVTIGQHLDETTRFSIQMAKQKCTARLNDRVEFQIDGNFQNGRHGLERQLEAAGIAAGNKHF